MHEKNKKLHVVTKPPYKFARELELEFQYAYSYCKENQTKSKGARPGANCQEVGTETFSWKVCVIRSKIADVNELATHQRLRSSGLNKEAEGFILSAQEMTKFVHTKLSSKFYQNGVDPKCWLYDENLETIDHSVSADKLLILLFLSIQTDSAVGRFYSGNYVHCCCIQNL